MYGLLLEAVAYCVTGRYGEETWHDICEQAGVQTQSFGTHQVYEEDAFTNIAKAACQITGENMERFMESMGVSFVNFVSQYGYDTILKVLGRNMSDFLNGLDNLHEYLRASYPKMRSPSFFVEHESKNGLTIHYRSKRKGYIYYVIGQIKQVGLSFYDTQVEVEIKSMQERGNQIHVVLQLYFDNKGFKDTHHRNNGQRSMDLTVKPKTMLNAFPFHILFGRDMKIRSIGRGLQHIMTEAVIGKRIDFVFILSRPPLGFTFDNIRTHTNSAFELNSVKVFTRRARRPEHNVDGKEDMLNDNEDYQTDNSSEDIEGDLHLRLKGQMKFLPQMDCFFYIATPIMENMDRMFELGLYLNDLSMHDVSRDLVLVGIQQSKQLKSVFNQEKQKRKRLEDITKMLETELGRTDQLLYQMIPKEVADQLRSGTKTGSMCSAFKSASVMFSDVVEFNYICSQVTPMQIVSLLNSYFTKLDLLTEKHTVYKVETVGSTYMIVSGAPTRRKNHAVYITEMALDALDSIEDVIDPSCGDHIRLRIGIHSGSLVAGVVGMQVPRYCLFGDTVNTSSRMQSTGAAMKIHVTEATKQLLESHPYELQERGSVEIKGKGMMKTYFVLRRTTDEPYHPPPSPKLTPSITTSHGSLLAPAGHKSPQYTPVNSHANISQLSLAVSKAALSGSNMTLEENGNGKRNFTVDEAENGAAKCAEGQHLAKVGVLRAKTCVLL